MGIVENYASPSLNGGPLEITLISPFYRSFYKEKGSKWTK